MSESSFPLHPSERRACSRCKVNPPKPGQRYCAECHAAYMRVWRRILAAEIRRLKTVIAEHNAEVERAVWGSADRDVS